MISTMLLSRPSRTRGSSLVVGLVMLLLMSVMGFAALRMVTLEERMSANLRDKDLSFQAAESVMRQVVNLIKNNPELYDSLAFDGTETGMLPMFGTSTGFLPRDASNNPVPESEFWIQHFNWNGNSVSETVGGRFAVAGSRLAGSIMPSLAQNPRYVIQRGIKANCAEGETGKKAVRPYRITVETRGRSAETRTVLQGTYFEGCD